MNGSRLPRGPLGASEERIRQDLEQEGPLPLEMTYGIVPVTLVSDATRPGRSGPRRGRAWQRTATGLVSATSVNLQVPVNSESEGFEVEEVTYALSVIGAAGDTFRILQAPPGVTVPVAPNTADVPYVEGFAPDYTPILSGSGLGGAPGAGVVDIWRVSMANVAGYATPVRIPLRTFFIPGATFVVYFTVTGATVSLTIRGRMF